MTEITEAVERMRSDYAHCRLMSAPLVPQTVIDAELILSELTRLQEEMKGLRDVLRPILRLRIAIAGAITEEPGAHRIRLEDGSFVEGPAADWLLETSKTFLAVTDAVQLALQGQQS